VERIFKNKQFERESDSMIAKEYAVDFEISGPAAMFSRPDTGAVPVSLPVPTPTALKAMFESVVRSDNAYFEAQSAEICSPVVFHSYTTNYGGPLRKSGTGNFQVFATVLENVCYKVHGHILSDRLMVGNVNPRHQLQAVFIRRLRLGQFYTTPFLGWKEFVPSYFGPLRLYTHADTSINMVLPSVLSSMYNQPVHGKISPRFITDVPVRKGVILYHDK
jgi:CRISPR-associated protein Cas5d